MTSFNSMEKTQAKPREGIDRNDVWTVARSGEEARLLF